MTEKRHDVTTYVAEISPAIPHVVAGYAGIPPLAAVFVPLVQCSGCQVYMYEHASLINDKFKYSYWTSTYGGSADAQLRRAGCVLDPDVKDVHGNPYCAECVKKLEVKFFCSLCHGAYPIDKVQREISGDPSEYICKPCYEITPAKEWDEKVAELEERHRYDFAP